MNKTNAGLVAPKAGPINELVKKWGKRAAIQEFTLPTGTTHPFFFFDGMTMPAIILPLTPDNQVVAVRQFRFGANAFVLELPGGCPERKGEPPEVTLRNELREETGYEPKQIVELYDPMWFEPASLRTSYRPFLALGCVRTYEPKPSEEEIMRVELYPVAQWADMVADGIIADDKSIAVTARGLYYLGWRLRLG